MELFLARQPIFSRDHELVGYELLYRQHAGSRSAHGGHRHSSRDLILHAFSNDGLASLTRGKTGFINFTREMLLARYHELLDPRRVVVELLEDVPSDPDVVQACQQLVKAGYTLALDDFDAASTPHAELIDLARIIKIDVLDRSPAEIRELIAPLRHRPVRLLAEKVETADVHHECRELGFHLFQGFFYQHPELVASSGRTMEQSTILRLLNLLASEEATDQEIEEGFQSDPSLTYRLLKILTSEELGGREVDTIRFAIRLIGRGALYKWLSLLLASSLADSSGPILELIRSALIRARFGELIGARASAAGPPDALFLLGLFSRIILLPALHDMQPVEPVLLAAPIRKALMERSGPYAPMLSLLEAYEAGDWEMVEEAAKAIGIDSREVPRLYLEAMTWAGDPLWRAMEARVPDPR